MNISIYGAGYVGLVSGICFAELGHTVCCVDVDPAKIEALKLGKLPIYEENLEALLKKNHTRLVFTTDFAQAVAHGEIQMIAVGTPPKSDGSADLQYVEAVAQTIGALMTEYRCIVNKSTVPVGTAHHVQDIVCTALSHRHLSIDVEVVSNPEFLREGRAVRDCLAPDRIVIGACQSRAIALMRELYHPLTEKHHPLIVMDTQSAELTKYAANAFLATKVSFMNEISQIAERTGASILSIKQGIGMDTRIGEKFLNAGCGFGGSCFPKDVSALQKIAEQVGYTPHILNAVLKTNDQQQQLLFQKISHYFDQSLKDKTIALWGLAFKPNTDDIRSASSRVLMEMLWQAGAIVKAYDPLAIQNIRHAYPKEPSLILCDTAHEALQNADVLAVVTEWDEFRQINFTDLKNTLKFPVIFDGRNMFDSCMVREAGLTYVGIGC